MHFSRASIQWSLRSRWLWRRTLIASTLGLLLGTAGCSSGGRDGDTGEGKNAAPSTSAAVSSVPASGLTNELQGKIVAALSTLGIRAAPAELSLDSAQIAAQFGDRSELIVNAIPIGRDGSSFSVRDERRIEDVVVKTVHYSSASGIRHRFECGSAVYETYGAVPPNFDSFDGFLARFIKALGCS